MIDLLCSIVIISSHTINEGCLCFPSLRTTRLITDLLVLFLTSWLLEIRKIEHDDSSHEQHLVFNSCGCREIQNIVVILSPDLRAESSSSLECGDRLEGSIKDIECGNIARAARASRTADHTRLAWSSSNHVTEIVGGIEDIELIHAPGAWSSNNTDLSAGSAFKGEDSEFTVIALAEG